MIFLTILGIYLLLITQPIFFILKFKQRFEIALPICVLLDVFIIFGAGMVFQNLPIGVYAVMLLSALSLIYAVMSKKKDFFRFLAEEVFTSGFYAFSFCYILCWILNANRFMFEFDDYRAYAQMPKQMFYTNKLYTDPNVFITAGKNTPPVLAVFEYLFLKISGVYKEGTLFAARSVMMISFLLPLTRFCEKKQTVRAMLMLVVSYIALSITASASTYDNYGSFVFLDIPYIISLQCDTPLAVLFGLFIFTVIFEKESLLKCFYCAVIGSALTLTKETGIALTLIGMTLYVFVLFKNSVFKHILAGKDRNKATRIIPYLFLWSMPLISYIGWQYYTGSLNTSLSIDEASSLTSFLKRFISTGIGSLPIVEIRAAIKMWITRPVTDGLAVLDCIPFCLCFIAAGAAFLNFVVKADDNDADKFGIKNNVPISLIIILFGFLLYSGALILQYSLVNYNGNGFSRYLSSYTTAMVITMLMFCFYWLNNTKKYKFNTVGLLVMTLIIALCPARVFYNLIFYRDVFRQNSYKQVAVYQTEISELFIRYAETKRESKPRPKTYVLANDNWGQDFRTYFLMSENLVNFNETARTAGAEKGVYTLGSLPSAAEFSAVLADGGYSYLTVFANNRDWGKLITDEYLPLFTCSAEEIPEVSFFNVLPVNGVFPVILEPALLK